MTYGQLFVKLNPNVKVVENGTCVWIYFDSANHDTFRTEWWNKEIPDEALKVEEPGWISVKDRLPNCNWIYLVWRPHYFGGEIGEPAVCYFDGQDTWHDSYGVDFERILNPNDVTHWMPLPEPPKEEQPWIK